LIQTIGKIQRAAREIQLKQQDMKGGTVRPMIKAIVCLKRRGKTCSRVSAADSKKHLKSKRKSKMRWQSLAITAVFALIQQAAHATPRLGDGMSDFRSRWGQPSHQEILTRTATLRWNGKNSRSESLVPGVFAVEVAFLDRTACQIVLRSKQRKPRLAMARLAKPVLPRFRATDFAKPKSDVNGIQIYELADGTSVSVKEHQGHTVIVIKAECFRRNEDVFNREAAKVRRPTSNH
jgi:hypothetical protein